VWRRIGFGVLWAIPAYLVGAIGGGSLVYALTANRHDRSMEAVMTGAFVLGPLVAVVAFLVGAARARTPAPHSTT